MYNISREKENRENHSYIPTITNIGKLQNNISPWSPGGSFLVQKMAKLYLSLSFKGHKCVCLYIYIYIYIYIHTYIYIYIYIVTPTAV